MRGAILCALAGLLLQNTPAPPTALFSVPFGGSTVQLLSSGAGELLPAQNFGAVAAGQTRQVLFSLAFSSSETVRGVQLVIQSGSKGEFAILSPFGNNLPLALPAGGAVPVMVEFRPRSAGTHSAELQVYSGVTPATILTRIPLTGTAQ